MKKWNITKSAVLSLLDWYEKNKRDLPWRKDPTPYHVWVSEIMLQQTRVEAVKGYYASFLSALPTIESLASAKEELILKLWEGLGYYNRVRNMQRAARILVEKHQGAFPKDYDTLLALPGIGPYTAAAIGSICFSLVTPAVDGNVLRVLSRLCACEEDVNLGSTKKAVYYALQSVMPKEDTSRFTQAWMELGATVCLPNGAPMCDACPLAKECRAHLMEREIHYPIRAQKKARTAEEMTVFLLDCGGMLALQKRPSRGLLAGLWEFPHVEGILNLEDAIRVAESYGVEPIDLIKTSNKTHIFTHKVWNMQGIYLTCAKKPKQFVWASEEDRLDSYALPTAFRQFLDE